MCVDWAGGDVCGRVFASGARIWKDQGKGNARKGTKEGTCLLFDVGVETCREGSAREGTREGMCSPFDAAGNVCRGGEVKVFANVSAGADTKANTSGRFECPSSLLERLQRRVALEALGERRSSLGSEAVGTETAGVGTKGGW